MNLAQLSPELLDEAAAKYDSLRLTGQHRGDAMFAALASLNGDDEAPIMPPEIPALVRAYVKFMAPSDFDAVLQEVTTGRSLLRYYTKLRDEVAWLLRSHRYCAGVIGQALGRDRTSIQFAFRRMEARLQTDAVLRARMTWATRMVRPAPAEAAA